ncbi:Pentatricopeptide repeat-containing protein [Quillaja saponaria]|uniref:Pentatricopeptide repeat-containing protein n=1 Tax=Quillaja saponaria TaxID=32244 RepID=A0AAD7Q9T7_QUISA|nr:Pentatricopeptide repeat-containing protein [Quillaja saponaria]
MHRALQSFHTTDGIDYGAYGCLIQHCTNQRLDRQAKQLHARLVIFSTTPDNFLASKLITFYSKSNHLREARKVFDRIPQKNVFSWNAMLIGYSLHGLYNDVLKLFSSLAFSGNIFPDNFTITCILKALAALFDVSTLAKEVHSFVLRHRFDSDIFVLNALITYYSRCDELGLARTIFDRMPGRDIVSWNSMIAGYSQSGFYVECKELYRKMGLAGLRPNGVTVVSVLQACGQSKDLIFGMEVHQLVNENQIKMDVSLCNALIAFYGKCVQEMQACGARPNSVTLSSILPTFSYFSNLRGGKGIHAYALRNSYNRNIYVATAIIDTYAKLGFIHWARHVFDQSKGRSLIIWTAIISAYAAHGDANVALSLYNEMLEDGIQPDPVTFTAVLSACGHSGAADEAWKIFDAMSSRYDVQPSVEQYACMVGVLSRAGRLYEAAEFINKMPVEPSAKVWGALLNGASICGNVEIGKLVCDHLFEIEPENTGNYIIMANLYSQAGRWEEADKVRERMNRIGLKKLPGGSWIETSGGLESFIARDVSHGRSDEIYTMLDGLLGLMIEEGYVIQDELDEESSCGKCSSSFGRESIIGKWECPIRPHLTSSTVEDQNALNQVYHWIPSTPSSHLTGFQQVAQSPKKITVSPSRSKACAWKYEG